MSSPNTERLSGLRAVRKVVTPSPSLRDLLANAKKMAEEIDQPSHELDPLVYAAEGLRVTIFERRIQASAEANDLLRKLHARMESPVLYYTPRKVRQNSGKVQTTSKKRDNPLPAALHEVEDLYAATDGPIVVRANKIVIANKSMDPRIGQELALVVDEGSGASILQAQQDVLLDAEMRMVSGRKLRKLAGTAIQALEMPFMRLPSMPESESQDIVNLLSADLPVHDIEIGPIEWKLNTVAFIQS
ncbi:MAG: hypothetical protein QFB87_01675 [Patescibacteria group bacterium]|nr:hypothetical protein [Patescibacteria group bacterium]